MVLRVRADGPLGAAAPRGRAMRAPGVGRTARRPIERVGRELDVAGRDIGSGRLDGGQDDAAGDDRQQQGRDERERVAQRDCDQRADGTLGRDDRRDDPDLADRECLVRRRTARPSSRDRPAR